MRLKFDLHNRTILWSLLLYIVLQLSSLFSGNALFLFAYLIVYLFAIVYAAITCAKSMVRDGRIESIIGPLIIFFVANLILFIIYLPTLVLNPAINWKLKGEDEVDPMLLQAYVPPVLFLFASIIILIASLVAKSIRRVKLHSKAASD
jgi:hypothetical protein